VRSPAFTQKKEVDSDQGTMHKPSGLDFKPSDEAKQYVPYLDFDEVIAVKVTELGDDGAD
jgi:hypothetical protein